MEKTEGIYIYIYISCAGTPEAPGLCQRPKLLQLVKTVVKQVVKTPTTPSLIQKVENQLMQKTQTTRHLSELEFINPSLGT